jgi:hypothetical protein
VLFLEAYWVILFTSCCSRQHREPYWYENCIFTPFPNTQLISLQLSGFPNTTNMDTTPMRWLATEIRLLEGLLLARLELEKDPNTESLDRLETFQLISDQMKTKGYHRTATAIERRLAGRISFRSSPTSKKAIQQHPSQLPNS